MTTSEKIARLIRSQIIGLIALFVALSGSAVAVQTANDAGDDATAAKKKKKAKRGPAGPQGPPGPSTGPASGDLTGTYPGPAIAPNAVTTGKIADNAVTTGKIANAAVTDTKLADNAVTNAKVADNAIGSAEVINGSLGMVDLKNTYSTTVSAGAPAANVDAAATATCGADRLLGGGYAWGAEVGTVNMDVSAPSGAAGDNPTGWDVEGSNGTGGVTLFVWAVCARV